MAKFLQLSVISNLDSDPEPEINVTPLDQKVSEEISETFEAAIALADLTDATPGNGQLDVKTKVTVPVVKLFGKEFRVTIPLTIVLKLVDKK